MINLLRLKNILAFREFDLPLRSLTLLSGTNSAGKSSLLHSFALLRQSMDANALPSAWMLNGDLVNLGTGRDLLHADPLASNLLTVDLSIGIEHDGGLEEWTAAYDAASDFLNVIARPSARLQSALFKPGFQYLRADRIIPSVTYPKSHEAVAVKRWLGAAGEHSANFLRVFGADPAACEQASHPKAVSNSLLDQTNAWLNDLSAGTTLAVADIPGTDFVRLSFTRSGPDVRTDSHRATNVGFGLTYALPVIVACLAATPNSLLLIENPEAHLHPSGQALMGRLCALASAGGAQVVVETHSDHVLNAIRLCVKRGEIESDTVLLHFFTREDGVLQPTLSTIEVSRDGMLPSWPKGFFDQWDRALDDLLG